MLKASAFRIAKSGIKCSENFCLKKALFGGFVRQGISSAMIRETYEIFTDSHLPNAFHWLIKFIIMLPSFSCDSIFCVLKLVPILDCPRKVRHIIMNLCSTNEGYKHDTQNNTNH